MSNREELVKTIDGTEHKRKLCRKMGNEYYLIGENSVENSGQCYLINKRYYKYNTGYIAYDHRINEYVVKNNSLKKGVVGVTDSDSLIIGSFSLEEGYSLDNYPHIQLTESGKKVIYPLLNDDIIKENYKYLYSVADDLYRERVNSDAMLVKRKKIASKEYKFSLPYSCKNMSIENNIEMFEKLYKPSSDFMDSQLSGLNPLLKQLSFGLEFETIRGVVPERICKKLGLIPLRDGSINGLEYVTIPLKGLKGLNALKDIVKVLSVYTEYDKNCSLHIHIGGMPRTEEYFLSLLRTLSWVEEDIYSMFPIYKRRNFGVKKKCYTKPLPFVSLFSKMDPVINSKNIKRNFDVLYRYLSVGQSYGTVKNSLDNVQNHPSDPGGSSKWNIKTRYHWVNMIPLLFGNKKTIEFRIHTPTYNFEKIINFLVMCSCIVKYAELNSGPVLTEPSLGDYNSLHKVITDVIHKVCPKQHSAVNHLSGYAKSRERYISMCLNNNDIICEEDNFTYNEFWTRKRNKELEQLRHRMYKPGTVFFHEDLEDPNEF